MTYNVKQIQERYAVSEGTVLGWIRSGELRAINVGRKSGAGKPRWRVTEKALEAFEQLRMPNPPTIPTKRRKRQTDIVEFY